MWGFFVSQLNHKTMGADSFITRSRGVDIRHAYGRAIEDAIEEYGNDAYNGTISTTTGFTDVTKKFRESRKERREFIDEMLYNAGKRDCFVIEELAPVVNTNKIKSVVEHNVVKGTSKWELRYVVYNNVADEIKSLKTKTEAIAFARKHVEATKSSTTIVMTKILVNQNSVVAQVKYKPSTQEREGQYVFFGMAAC